MTSTVLIIDGQLTDYMCFAEVVEDARQNFNASSTTGPLPPLPVAPAPRPTKMKTGTNELSKSQRSSTNDLSKSQRSSTTRVARKILAANQIFVDEYESGEPSPLNSSFDHSQTSASFLLSPREKSFLANNTLPTIPSEDERSRVEVGLKVQQSPSRVRRATVVTRSPEPKPRPEIRRSEGDEVTASPSKRREKSRSQNDLGRAITPVTQLEFEIERREFLSTSSCHGSYLTKCFSLEAHSYCDSTSFCYRGY